MSLFTKLFSCGFKPALGPCLPCPSEDTIRGFANQSCQSSQHQMFGRYRLSADPLCHLSGTCTLGRGCYLVFMIFLVKASLLGLLGVKKVVVVSLWGSSQFGCWRSDLIRKNPTYIIIHIYIYIHTHNNDSNNM